jgi:A/G-specific adenine glycosylase
VSRRGTTSGHADKAEFGQNGGLSQAQALLDWYRKNARALPWRQTRDPYAIWVSEVMLQQTRVDTAIPYYRRFLERFPSIRTLADASDDLVRSTWSGLGYYRRARMLHQAAKDVVAAGGELPRSPEELMRLPGFGPYTAAAVGSIAFGVPVAVVDGNVERVTSRLAAISDDPKSAQGRRQVEAVAQSLLVESSAGDSNQALMELGATVCLPRKPRCENCPLADGCLAFRRGEAEGFPRLRPRSPARAVRLVAIVLEQPDLGVWLRRRSDSEALLPGKWEPPWIEIAPRARVTDAIRRAFPGVVASVRLGTVRHTMTTRRYAVDVWRAQPDGSASGWVGESASRFVLPAELERLPTSALALKVLALASGQ